MPKANSTGVDSIQGKTSFWQLLIVTGKMNAPASLFSLPPTLWPNLTCEFPGILNRWRRVKRALGRANILQSTVSLY